MSASSRTAELAAPAASRAKPRGITPAQSTALLAALACALCTGAFGADPGSGRTIAVLDFDYVDSSGEPSDQSAKHRAQLERFMSSVRRDLESRGGYRVVPLTCEPEPCSTDANEIGELVASARRQDVDYVMLGGFHKVSTLVQWARAQVIDVSAERLAFDKLLSFRGDNDTAWKRTEEFLIRELLAADLDHPEAAAKEKPANP